MSMRGIRMDSAINVDDVLLGRSHVTTHTTHVAAAWPRYVPSQEWVRSLLSLGALSSAAIRIVQEGVTSPRDPHTANLSINGSVAQGLVHTTSLREDLDQGRTVVVDDIGLWDPYVVPICAAVFTGSWRYANASYFVTPRETHGFPFHADAEMTAVFQIAGRKQWDFVDAPASHAGGLHEDGMPTGPRGSIILSPGDVLFVPERYPHRTNSIGTEASIHLTVGIREFTAAELVKEVAARGFGSLAPALNARSGSPQQVVAEIVGCATDDHAEAWDFELAKASIRIMTGGYVSSGRNALASPHGTSAPVWLAPTSGRGVVLANGKLMQIPGSVVEEFQEYFGRRMLATEDAIQRKNGVLSREAQQIASEIWNGVGV